MVNVNPHAYNITVRQIEEDGDLIFEATIAELPDAADYADSYVEAYELAILTIQGAAELYAQSGKPFPNPIKCEDNFSGRVTLRMPKSIHAKTNRIAEQEGVSLNQFIVTTIAEKVGSIDTLIHIEKQLGNFLRKTATTISNNYISDPLLNTWDFNSTSVSTSSGNVTNIKDIRIAS